MCCVVLHNMTIEWNDDIGDIDEDEVDDFVPPVDHIDEYEVWNHSAWDYYQTVGNSKKHKS